METPELALHRAVEAAKGQSGLARLLGVKQGHVWHWLHKMRRAPPDRVLAIEAATGVSRHDLRPDIYPPPAEPAPAEAPAPEGRAA